MIEVLENPHHHKSLSNLLKNYRRVHVGHFVIAFRIMEEGKMVRFVAFDHHDSIYEQSFND